MQPIIHPSPKMTFIVLSITLLFISLLTMVLGPVNHLIKTQGIFYIASVALQLRLPRLIATWVIGATLAVMGLTSQRIFHNHLASPDVLGISSSASLGAFISITLYPTISPFWGAFTASLLLLLPFLLLIRSAHTTIQFLLLGVAVGSISAGMLAFLINISDTHTVSQYLFWSLGSLQIVDWRTLSVTSPILMMLIVLVWRKHLALDLLLFGDTWAETRGVRVKQFRITMILFISIAVALTVSLAGPIGFIALVAPHIAKRILPHQHAWLIPISAIIGALILTISDALARLLFLPYEIKAGILLNILGGLYFIFLLTRRHIWYDD
ncbi:iron ABC transporter permease [Entomospira entomophila]|uniref:Iron ABC transporter permease n=1 Tax=Entomospira entomophila TaxID=2719988 RepID=A0A968KQM8_9SPIO|nr:iron ABC transporter permease [Entomospira entomophilus]NIZ39959.1 iron ABC transporter permease [Entomospira entomophilus]WDI35520.1 iron ABC transporter permease [Entomospira entomophilus]